jgi:preprotein translocase subunit SecE
MLQLPTVKRLVNYFTEVKVELSKVIWPKRDEVIRLTLVIFIISTVVGAYVGGLDYGLTKVLEYAVAR